ncbi:HOOK protein-domain-containing protein [Chytriomyces sp. MP71]|nr:HOOK protein-domain-containing protein [Chytriomyces sp. MP71]
MDSAFLEWASTFDLSRPPVSLIDFCDGSFINEILAEIDSIWFKRLRPVDAGDNWVLKFNGLKKTYKLITSYYEEVLNQPHVSAALVGDAFVPNLTAIARDSDTDEVLKLARLIVCLAVQCDNNQAHIERIQGLKPESQHALMLAIEQVMTRLTEASAAGLDTDRPERPGTSMLTNDEKIALEAENATLNDQLRLLKKKYEDVMVEKNQLFELSKEAHSLGGDTSKLDFVLRSQNDTLKAELEKSEARRAEAETVSQQQGITLKDMTKKLEETTRRAEEASRLKDQLDEFRHFADKLQKSEAMIEKYKKKMEESADLRKQMKALETQNANLLDHSNHLEEEYRKVSSYKPLMDTYKEQIGSMEGKNSSLQVENSKLEFEINEARAKVDRLEALRRNDLDQIQMLEDQVRELELTGGSGGSMEGTLGADLSKSLRQKISQLEKDLETSKSAGGVDRIYVLENLLEDANRMKDKFEKDFMQAFQRNLALENEMKQLRNVSSADSDETISKLRAQLGEYQQELATAQRRLAEAEIALTQGIGQSLGLTSVDQETVKRQIDSYEKEIRLQSTQINKLQGEKGMLESHIAELRDSLLQEERTNEDLKSALNAFENKTQADETAQKVASTTQQIVLLTEQNTKVLKALKEAKKHILTQDKQIKDLKAVAPKDNFMEAIQSYEATIAEKNSELERAKKEVYDTRRAAKREQALMLSAWCDLGISQQRRANASASATNSAGKEGTPMSWLAQQRRDATIHARR